MKRIAAVAALALAACSPGVEAHQKVVSSAQVAQATQAYEAAERAGDPLDLCVRAKQVAVAYEDARETANAAAWRSREREACRLAMDRMGVTPPPAGAAR